MQVTIRIPSKKVPYGYLEYQQDVVSVEPQALAEMYAELIKRYQQAEVAAFERPLTKPVQLGPVDDTSVEEATKMLNDGLGGVEEVEENAPAKPWPAKTEATATTEKKVWESNDDDWSFS
jgi:hypothetical protein